MKQKPLGEFLRDSRREKHLTQRQLAALCGVAFSHICEIENGRHPSPRNELLSLMALHLSLDPDLLFLKAGRVPPDISTFLQENPQWCVVVRAVFKAKVAEIKLV